MEVGIPYLIESSDGSVLVCNGFDNDPANGYLAPYFRVIEVEGLDGATVRTPTEERPQKEGLIAFPFLRGGRFPALRGQIVPTTLQSRRQMEDKLRRHMSKLHSADGVLRWRPRAAHYRWPLELGATDVQTDATRAAAVQGDGRAADQSYGIWEGTTNETPNGGFETGAGGIVSVGSTANDVTSQKKFGNGSLQVVTNNAGANEGVFNTFVAGGPGTEAHVISAWVKKSTGTGTVRLKLASNTGTPITTGPPVTIDTNWQRLTLLTANLSTATTYRLYVETDVQQNMTFFVDGIQAERQPIATPYVETNSGAASRTASEVLVQADPAGGAGQLGSQIGLNSQTGWIAMKVRPQWANTADPHGTVLQLFSWAIGNEVLQVYYDTADDKFKLHRRNSASDSTAAMSAAQIFAAGTTKTIVAAWTPTEIKISVDGAAFVASANTTLPSAQALNVISYAYGHRTANDRHFDGEFLWVAHGNGTLTDRDAFLLGDPGSTLPIDTPTADGGGGLAGISAGAETLSEGAAPVRVWTAATGSYLVPQTRRCPIRAYEPIQIKGEQGIIKEARLAFVSPDPLIQSDALYTALSTSSPLFAILIDSTLDGSDFTGLDALWPVITISAGGSLTALDAKNDTSGKFVRLSSLGMSSGQAVTIDMRNETVIKNDGTDLAGKIDLTVSEFFSAAPGAGDTITMRGVTGTISQVSIAYRLVFAG